MTDTDERDDVEPQVTDPDQMIEVFETQRLDTLRLVDQARDGMHHVKLTLESLFQFSEHAEAADVAWRQLKPVRKVLKEIDAVMVGAYNVMETLTEQRDQVAGELDELYTAIEGQDVGHPMLTEFADSIDRNARLEGHNEGYDAGYDDGIETGMNGGIDPDYDPDDSFTEDFVSDVTNFWNIPSKMADDIVAAVRGEIELTSEQREAFRAFIATF